MSRSEPETTPDPGLSAQVAETLQESRRFLRATLDALPDPVAVLNEAGIVLGVNRAWELSAAAGDPPLTACGPGTSYLAICAGAPPELEAAAQAVAGAIREIFGGRRRSFSTEYCHRQGERARWFAVRLRRFPEGSPGRLVVLHQEITDHKRTEQTLRQSHLRTRAILETAVDAIITVGETGIIETVNPAAERIFGYRAEELVGENVGILMPSPYREEHGGYLARYRETGERRIIGIGREIVGRKSDGTVFPIDLAVSEVFLDGRRVFTGTVRDITERKRLEEELAARARRQEALAHLGLRALAGIELGSLLSEAAETVAETLGVECAKVLELSPGGEDLLLVAGVGWKPGRVGTTRVEAGSDSQAGFTLRSREPVVVRDLASETRFRAPELLRDHGVTSGMSVIIQGSERPYGVLGAHSPQPRTFSWDEVRFLQSAANVLALAVHRHEAEAALTESDRRFRAIFDQSYQAIGLLKPDGTVLEANPAMLELSGLDRSGLVGRPFWEGRWWGGGPEIRERLREAVGKAAAGAFVRWEMEVPGAAGPQVTLDFSIKPVADESGRVVLLIPEGRDVTEHRQLEAQFLQAQKMEAIGRLAGGVAHDFNTLLGAITGYSEMLLDRAAGSEPLRRPAEQIHRCAERGAALTRQLLAFSRRQVLQPRVLNLSYVIAEMDDMLQRLIGDGIELILDLEPDLDWVKVDGGQFEQVIMNLIVNAVDAMPEGGRITIRTATLDRDEATGHGGRELPARRSVLVSVRDTGVGMDEETQSHLFEPFFTTKEPGKGTGLGLATVYGIVQQSGGGVAVDSRPGGGTTLEILLPSASPPEPSAPPEPPPAEPRRGTESVLLVEDDEMFRLLLVEVLEAHGYEVLAASEPAEALALSERHPREIHLLVSDMVMPGMTGSDLAKRLSARRPELRVILMSGYSGDALASSETLDRGAVFLQKPFRTKDLVRTVREVLDGSPR